MWHPSWVKGGRSWTVHISLKGAAHDGREGKTKQTNRTEPTNPIHWEGRCCLHAPWGCVLLENPPWASVLVPGCLLPPALVLLILSVQCLCAALFMDQMQMSKVRKLLIAPRQVTVLLLPLQRPTTSRLTAYRQPSLLVQLSFLQSCKTGIIIVFTEQMRKWSCICHLVFCGMLLAKSLHFFGFVTCKMGAVVSDKPTGQGTPKTPRV